MVLCTLVTYFSLYCLHALHWTIVAMLLISQSLGAHWYLPQPRTFKWCQCVKAGGCICILLMHDTASQCLVSIPLPFSLAMFSISLSLHWIIVNCPLSKPSYSLNSLTPRRFKILCTRKITHCILMHLNENCESENKWNYTHVPGPFCTIRSSHLVS